VGKVDALLDVALQARNRRLEQLLLLLGDVAEDVDGLLGAVGLEACQSVSNGNDERKTYAKLDGDGEEVDASLGLDLLAAGDAGEVDVAGLDEALGALEGLEELLGEPAQH
jgi:hypothetical protein